jgi:chromosomal replication initiation ATPase DnaA
MFIVSTFRQPLPTRPATAEAARVIELVSREMDISKSLLLHHSRCRAPAARARQIAMYLTHVAMGQSLTAVGLAFKRDRTTVSYACGLVEDMRDDLKFDAEMDRLEHLLTGGQGDE